MRKLNIIVLPVLFVIAGCNAEAPTATSTQKPELAADTTNAVAAADATDATDAVVAAAAGGADASGHLNSAPENTITNLEKQIACKKAIGELMGKPTSIMKASLTAEGYARVTYTRPDDGKVFKNECKFEGNSIIWRGVDIFAAGEGPGRWRDTPSDEKITWQKNGKNIDVNVSY